MTTKATLSQIEVNERRLKGIFDQIEAANYKKAVSEAEKVLKKNPNLAPAKVLKAVSLFRLKRCQEAYILADGVAQGNPTDESTLNALSYFYRESNQRDKIICLYEEAYKQFPNREEICANLFYCYVKHMKFSAQQKIASQLKKLNASHLEYGMWPIVSNVLQGVYGDDERLLKLGEAMMAKLFNSNSILSAERIMFFVYICVKLNKLESVLTWLDGDVLKDVITNEQNEEYFIKEKIKLLEMMGKINETLDLRWKLIQKNVRDTITWKKYIDTAILLDLPEDNDHSMKCIISKFNEYKEENSCLEIISVHISQSLEKANHYLYKEVSPKIESLLHFTEINAKKPRILDDVHKFLRNTKHFSDDDRRLILEKLISKFGDIDLESLKEGDNIEKFFLIESLKRAVEYGEKINIDTLISVYESNAKKDLNRDKSSTEIRCYDRIASLVISILYKEWQDNPTDIRCVTGLERALCLGLTALEHSPTNHYFMLQLSTIFGHALKCGGLLIEMSRQLEVKQIMHDSVGYIYFLPLLQCPLYRRRIGLYKQNCDRREKNYREIEEGLVIGYKLGNYARIPEMLEFYNKLKYSVIGQMTEVEVLFYNTVINTNDLDELFEACGFINVEEIESLEEKYTFSEYLEKLQDVRDFSLSIDFPEFRRCWSEEEIEISFKNIKYWIEYRCIILRILYAGAKLTMESVVKLDRLCYDSTVSFKKSDVSNHYRILQLLVDRLKHISSESNECKSEKFHLLQSSIPGCSATPQLDGNGDYLQVVCASTNCLLAMHDLLVLDKCCATENGDESNGTRHAPLDQSDMVLPIVTISKFIVDQVSDLQEKLGQVTTTSSTDNDSTTLNSGWLTILIPVMPQLTCQITALCDLVSVVVLILCMIDNMIKPIRPKQAKRKGKKKKAAQPNSGTPEEDSIKDTLQNFYSFTNFGNCVKLMLTHIENVSNSLTDLIKPLGSYGGTAGKSSMSAGSTDQMDPDQRIIRSWRESIGEANCVLDDKKKQLQRLYRLVLDDDILIQDKVLAEVSINTEEEALVKVLTDENSLLEQNSYIKREL